MALEKLTILMETSRGRFEREIVVLFNPNQLIFSKTVQWNPIAAAERDVPKAQFTHGQPTNLVMDLFFDTYENRTDVRDHTRKLASLVRVEGGLHQPPLCRLQWGNFDFEHADWALQSLRQTLSLFLDDGTPVRATLACTFQQWRSDEEEEKEIKKASPDVAKTRTLRRGETLSSIAAEEYNDPAVWRAIAEANGIDNPRRVEPGQVLAIPPLETGAGRSS